MPPSPEQKAAQGRINAPQSAFQRMLAALELEHERELAELRRQNQMLRQEASVLQSTTPNKTPTNIAAPRMGLIEPVDVATASHAQHRQISEASMLMDGHGASKAEFHQMFVDMQMMMKRISEQVELVSMSARSLGRQASPMAEQDEIQMMSRCEMRKLTTTSDGEELRRQVSDGALSLSARKRSTKWFSGSSLQGSTSSVARVPTRHQRGLRTRQLEASVATTLSEKRRIQASPSNERPVATPNAIAEEDVNLGANGTSRRLSFTPMGLFRQDRQRTKLMEKVFTFLDDPQSGFGASAYAKVIPLLVMATVSITWMQTLDPPTVSGLKAGIIESVFDLVFLVDISLRYWSCPDRTAFFLVAYNNIDLAVALIPLIIRASLGFNISQDWAVDGISVAEFLLIGGPITVLRLLKTTRYLEKLTLIFSAFRLASEALPVLLFMMSILALLFSSLIYIVEPRDNIDTLPRAMWLTIVTMTTVGYGDYYPVTGLGTIIVTCLIACSVTYMAILPGILGNAFTEVWEDRDRLLLIRRTRDRLIQEGYKPRDLPEIFRLFDRDQNGDLDLNEFRSMIMEMGIGLSEERIIRLFHSFDADGSGAIDDKEFVRELFPGQFRAIYLETESDDKAAADPQQPASKAGALRQDASGTRAESTRAAFDSQPQPGPRGGLAS